MALVLVVADTIAVASGVPGAKPLAALLFLASATTVVVALRSANRWRPAPRWRAVIAAVAREAARDLGGSALLLLALACALAIVALVPITALLVAGPLALATVAVDSRAKVAVDRGGHV